jgi:PAS domain S-box-containing protein
MYQEPETSVTPVLEQELKELSKLSEEVNAIIRRSGSSLPREAAVGMAQLGATLDRLSKQMTQQDDERNNLLALADIGQVINSSLETDEVLRIVMDTIVRLTGAERGFLMLRDENDEFQIRLARNWEQETLDSSEFAVSSTIVNRVASDGQAVLTTNAQEDPRFGGQESIVAFNLRSILCVPLKVKDVITGVIYADNRVRTGLFTEAERDLLAAFANQAAVAIENARLFESVRQTLAEVTELKNLMDNVFSSIASGVITADVEDKITLINSAAERILGHSREELMGKALNEILPPIATPISAHLENVRKMKEAVVGIEVQSNLPDRGDVDLRFNFSPLKDAQETSLGIAIVLDDLTDQKKLEAQRRLFEKMVSPAVIEQLDPESVAMGGKRGEITALFADIRGFTTYSESLDPEALVSVLNQYLAACADAVLMEEGTIDKFMGDAVMAWFNAPIPQKDHTLRAVKSAIGIRDSIKALHKKLPKEAHLSFGVGIHFGDAVLGLVGTERRLDYTAIGDSVNTAKRIQENSGPNQILISEDAYNLVKTKIKVNEVEPVTAKGKSRPIAVYEVLSLK